MGGSQEYLHTFGVSLACTYFPEHLDHMTDA